MTQQRDKQTAKQAYDAAKTDIANLMGWLECELEKEPADLNWGHTGSLQKVRADLLETLAFISGIDADSLNEALEEARLC
jgi:hypothetical protein